MTDYIKREDALQDIDNAHANTITQRGCKDYWSADLETQLVCDGLAKAIEAIFDTPPADVRDNVRGEWKEIAERGLCDLRRCSNCGHIEAVGLEIITPKPNYCPNCGADMRPITALSKNAEIDSNLKRGEA